jgi:hypothetical protein
MPFYFTFPVLAILGQVFFSALGPADGQGAVDQPDVAEGLREIADEPACGRVDLLGREPLGTDEADMISP